jgi:tRNA A-37 threonylcarbamoyl transferase component Bud32
MTLARRQKWASQIRETVDQLHEMGVIWGDGKTSNIIVDEEDDAWLIDFAGGFTQGWVDEELADTVEGDEQAVRKIIEFLSVKEGN